MNVVNLIGRVTKDIELKYTSSNKEYVKFTLAVNRNFKGASGEYETDFINCITWHHSAKFMSNYVKKGNRISLTGRIQTGSYQDKEGRTVYTTDVVAENVQSLEPKQSTEPYMEMPQKNEEQRKYDSIEVDSEMLPF